MPYINKTRRMEVGLNIDPDNPGELNYILTRIILDYLKDPDTGNGPVNYEKYNAVIGALECCKLELYRRMIAPYEDKKIQENGDVY